MNLLHHPVEYYDPFLEVCGNRNRRLHFIALRFKRPILTYTFHPLHSEALQPPCPSILYVRGTCPPLLHPSPDVLLFTQHSHAEGIQVKNDRVETLLRALFRSHDPILFSSFKSDVLFLVATQNPFLQILKPCRKDRVFKILCAFLDARHTHRALTLEELSQLRFFKRYDGGTLTLFNRWSSFAFALCRDACQRITGSSPSATLGREIFSLLKRSKRPLGPLPPPDFYFCEILLTDTEPVGVAFPSSIPVNYVSPMVVSRLERPFRDINSVLCDDWLPLFQTPDQWRQHGAPYYVFQLLAKKKKLYRVLSWLQGQTCEKYVFLYQDLVQVARILFEERYIKPT